MENARLRPEPVAEDVDLGRAGDATKHEWPPDAVEQWAGDAATYGAERAANDQVKLRFKVHSECRGADGRGPGAMTRRPVPLINPRIGHRRNARIPLSLLQLAAALEGLRPWRVLDGNFEPRLIGSAIAALQAQRGPRCRRRRRSGSSRSGRGGYATRTRRDRAPAGAKEDHL